MSNLITKIKALFEAENTSATENFMDVKTDGGLLLRISGEIKTDTPVQEINADGTLSDLKDGDYTLEDGTTIGVLGGKIAEVATAEAEATEENEGEMAEKPKEEEKEAEEEKPAAEEKEVSVEEKIAALEKKLAEVIEAINKMAEAHNNMSAENEKVKAENEKLSAEFEAEKAKNEELAKKAAAPAISTKKFEKEGSETKSNKNLTILERVVNLKK